MSFAEIPLPNYTPGSVTNWIDALRDVGPDGRIQHEIWDRYFRKLSAVARKHLSPNVRRTVDEEDIALSALNSFFGKIDDGGFPQLANRNQLWTLLTTIATYKAVNARIRQNAKKRGGGKVRGDSAFADGNTWREFAANDPGPSDVAEFRDLVSRMLSKLDPTLRSIAHEKLIGKSDAEIAETLEVSPRTIHRKLTRIRTEWQAEFD